ncbi:MAG: hypothetical protein ACP5I1_20865 [Candidatus Hinthialibacter sp.]
MVQREMENSSAYRAPAFMNSGAMPISDWHVYVQKGNGGYFLLGNTRDGAGRSWTWVDPDINAPYQFHVWGSYKNESIQTRLIVLSQAAPMRYNIEGGDEIK